MSGAKKREPKKGDMIEFPRGDFSHWAVYVGGDEVVHVTNDYIAGSIAGNVISSATSKAVIKKETLETVAGDGKWRINNYLDNELEARPAEDIVKDALAQVGKEVPYCVRTKNCEHFATELRYGEPRSHQVVEIVAKAMTILRQVAALLLGLAGVASAVRR